ncbi:MAG: septum formation protein Maf [Bacteroidales bacterium]|nr:septum formation protein Maf [Candidatus Physcousia equi]
MTSGHSDGETQQDDERMKNYKIVLASGSPRRKELLAGLGVDFEVRLLDGIDESYPKGLNGEEIAAHISSKKAAAYKDSLMPNELIITADTIVYLEGTVLGKPKDEEEARTMLKSLSGKTHEVITGVTLMTTTKQQTFASVSKVSFAQLTDNEIDHYVTHFHPTDKAGAYGIQEWIGFVGVERIEGSYFNVMGLPVQRLYQELKKL